jgi:hypothetical protein
MRDIEQVIKQIEASGKVTRQDISDILLNTKGQGKKAQRDYVTEHLGRHLRGEKRGKSALQAILDDLDSYAEVGEV